VNLASCSSSSSSSSWVLSSKQQHRRREEKRTASSSSSSSRILFPGEGDDDDDLKKKKRNDEDVDGANAIVSRHFTVDPTTGVPFALSPVLSFPSSSIPAEREEDDEEDKEEKVVVEEEENPLYKGYYCPRAEHRKCEDTDSPEKYHGVDAWTIDETFSGVSPPENVPQSAMFEAARAPSSWYTLGLREGEGESVLREVLRQRRRGGVVGGGGGDGTASRRRRQEGGEEDDDDDEGDDDDDDEWWMRTHENAEAFYEDDDEETSSSSSSSAVSSRNRKVEDAFNGAMRVLQFHDPDLERVRRSTKYKNVKHRGEETMRAIIEERFGKVKVVLREFLEKLSSSIETKSPMELYIELVQIGNCFRASGELGDADYATDAFELALIARSIARTPNVEVYIFYGEFKMNLNELPAAKALLQEGLKHDSRNQPIYFALGNVCANQGQWDEAIAAFGKAVEILPGHARSREALEAAKKHAVGSNRRMYAALCLLLLAVLACSTMITFLMSNGSSYSDSGSSSSSSKEKKARESKKRK